jgi:hypothetical protein
VSVEWVGGHEEPDPAKPDPSTASLLASIREAMDELEASRRREIAESRRNR